MLSYLIKKQFYQLLICAFFLVLSQSAFSKNALPALTSNGESLPIPNNALILTGLNIRTIAVSPDSTLIAVDGHHIANNIQLWDAHSGRIISVHSGHTDSVNTLAFSPDGKTIASGSKDQTIRIWSVKSGKTINTLAGHLGSVNTLVFSPNGKIIASGSEDNTIRLWDAQSGEVINTLIGHSDTIKSLAYSPDGKVITSGANDKTARLWDAKSGELINTLKGHSDWVSALAFSPDGKVIVSGSYDTSIRLWSAQTGEFIKALTGHSNWVNTIAFSPDGKVIVSGAGGILSSEDNSVRLWNAQSGELIKIIKGHRDNVYSLAFTPDGKFIASSGSSDGTIRLWNAQSGETTRVMRGHGSDVRKVAYSPDGKTIASISYDEYIKLWNAETGEMINTLVESNNWIGSFAFSPDNKSIVSSSNNNTIHIWDIRTGEITATLKGEAESHQFNYVNSIAYSPDGKIIASASNDNTISLWNTQSLDLIKTINNNSSSSSNDTLSFSPNNKFLVSENDENTVRMWDTQNFEPMMIFEGQSQRVKTVALSPDGKTMATGSRDSTVRLWSTESGEIIKILKGHSGFVNTVAFNHDGSVVASGGSDNLIWLWDVASGKNINILKGHSGSVNTLAFSPDGKVIASGGDDNFIHLWNAQSGTIITRMFGGINGTWLSIDSKGNFKRGDDGTMLLEEKKGRISPIVPSNLPPIPDKSLSIKYLGEEITLKGAQKESFSLQVTNNSEQKVLWISPKLVESEAYILYDQSSIYQLQAGQSVELEITVSAKLPYTQPTHILHKSDSDKLKTRKLQKPLEIKISAPNQTNSNSISIPVEVTRPKLELISAELLDNTLKLVVKNTGGLPISNTRYNLSISDFPELKLDEQSAEAAIAPEGILERVFALPKDFNLSAKNKINLQVRTLNLPFMVWNFDNQQVQLPVSTWLTYISLLILVFLAIIYTFYIRIYQHPMVLELSKKPSSLFKLPIEQLNEAENRLVKISRLDKVLSDAEVSPDTLKIAISFHLLSPEEKAHSIASRLGAKSTPVNETLANAPIMALYQLKLNAGFPLNIDRALLCFPQKTAAEDVFTALKQQADIQSAITLIIGDDSAYQRKLYSTTRDTSNKWVAPQGSEITRLLLAPDAEETLAEILSGQLSLQQISPYRIGGGVSNESVFFGRRELISQIINCDPANYLMAGGRQVGKSTLLKAIERRYADNPQVECVYFTLSSEVLVPRLASLLKLERTDDPEVLATQLDERIRESGQRFVFLVDEADRFIAQEKAHDYAILNVFRRLSEEGNCTFILAGFWQLYQHAVLDYQSPIRNFGELLSVGELEKSACVELITQPMKTMNLSYANDSIIEHIADSCGQRANLIAIACQYIVRHLAPNQRLIEASDVAPALTSDELRRALSGWVVGETDLEQAYERLVVYGTIAVESFTAGELLAQAEQQGVSVDTLELDRTLSRLELSFILGRKEGRWFYRVPLFVDYIREDSPELKLKAELQRITT